MSIPFWCLFFAALLIYLAKAPVAKAMREEGRGYDNRNPRAQQARLTGFGARAVAAHQNSIEIFPLFAAGVLVAQVTQTQGWFVDLLAILFIVSRVLYLFLYWNDKATLRSSVWVIGLVCCLLLMLSPAL
ncbi:MAPEG family protein [Pseudomonas sp. BN102]|uniref:MAPEG family protein n=1 Tax=Pseudomonas sp. BN102 TaxID=2567886 RepID=UPI002453E052|nr:MAPEG family protein [Pseudomonas sp. BN102]MDH4609427.1 MAPEG family protein [Pseudomonas sp. BN102]